MEDEAATPVELLSYSDSPYLSPPQRDHLSTLPNELLSYIFHLVSQHRTTRLHPSTGPSLPVSKRLLPFTRASLYRRINLATLTAIQSFGRTLKESTSLGTLVDEVKLDLVAEEEKQLEEEEMYEVFARLDQLRVLVVGCQKVAGVVLSEWFMATFCPELEILSFDSPKALHDFPIDEPQAFSPLSLHPKLHSLRVFAPGSDFDMQPRQTRFFFPPESAKISTLKELYLDGVLVSFSLHDISRLCDKLEHLHLTIRCSEWDLIDTAFRLLGSLPCASALSRLTLHVTPDDNHLLTPMDVPLLDFPNLLDLTWNMHLRLPSRFRVPRLRTLTLGDEYSAEALVHDINLRLLDWETQQLKLGGLEVLIIDEVDLSPVIEARTFHQGTLDALGRLCAAGVRLQARQRWRGERWELGEGLSARRAREDRRAGAEL